MSGYTNINNVLGTVYASTSTQCKTQMLEAHYTKTSTQTKQEKVTVLIDTINLCQPKIS
jgi:hypothetical protein